MVQNDSTENTLKHKTITFKVDSSNGLLSQLTLNHNQMC